MALWQEDLLLTITTNRIKTSTKQLTAVKMMMKGIVVGEAEVVSELSKVRESDLGDTPTEEVNFMCSIRSKDVVFNIKSSLFFKFKIRKMLN
jgi:hypothetical protein